MAPIRPAFVERGKLRRVVSRGNRLSEGGTDDTRDMLGAVGRVWNWKRAPGGVTYLASEYGSGETKTVRERNYERALAVVRYGMDVGVAIYSPIVYTHPLSDAAPLHGWYAYDLNMLDVCVALLVMPPKGKSVGVGVEVGYALARGRPVFVLDEAREPAATHLRTSQARRKPE